MSRNLVEFLKLYQGVSQSTGKPYFRGRMNGLRLVGFQVEAKEGEDAHIQLYVDASGDKPSGNAGSSTRGHGGGNSHRSQGTGQSSYQGSKARRQGDASRDDGRNPPAPFNDRAPFGDGDWTP